MAYGFRSDSWHHEFCQKNLAEISPAELLRRFPIGSYVETTEAFAEKNQYFCEHQIEEHELDKWPDYRCGYVIDVDGECNGFRQVKYEDIHGNIHSTYFKHMRRIRKTNKITDIRI